ncbi:S41 family peptidase [Amylibacter sp.]|jgi:carboxyl-terminal processing protease|nr:S41 family peptidase [Amylibacter sp.]MDA8914425.1 S41 family peptidase [Amylibacter sp.]MDA9926886.1 S41 family peptidase [Amylibacter sp.]MDB4079361.1 S41 family peptidase [Amylibacter sp.]MDB9850806.1 S41 family peptidase [Amylibacter sp.]|tara:strand:+ start:1740 stop:3065 length:1326 start_codon:yes stop_codon:yes gene_type:complete
MNKLILTALAGVISGALITTQFTDPLIAQETKRIKSTYENLDLFGDIFERIRSSYVEEIDEEKLIESAISGMLTSLDPHSSYMAPEDFSTMQVQTRGEFGGLGIEVTQENGFVKVVSPIDDTPADKAGVEAGDFITKVDGESTLGKTLDEAVDKMRGPVGSEIIITIVREGIDEPFDISIIRDTIEIKAVKARTEGKTIVLRVSSFTSKTYPNLKDSLEKEIKSSGGLENINGVVVDLRNNPGGLLNQAIRVSDAFLNSGEIVSTRGRGTRDSERYNATPGDLTNGKPVVVLINGGSASASEIVAGALQDHQRAIIVGTKSFGKGSVQTIIPLSSDGAAMRLTTARYYTPSGRSIQSLGVSPDILVEQRIRSVEEPEKQNFQRFESDLENSLSNDSLTEDERKLLEEERTQQEEIAKMRNDDYQLAYALDILKGLATLSQK